MLGRVSECERYLFAERLDVVLGELFAVHQLLDPHVQLLELVLVPGLDRSHPHALQGDYFHKGLGHGRVGPQEILTEMKDSLFFKFWISEFGFFSVSGS